MKVTDKICVVCGASFTAIACHAERRKTCSKRCMAEFYRRRLPQSHPSWKGGKEDKVCTICGSHFYSHPSKNQYTCSRGCAAKTRVRDRATFCRWCGRKFVAKGHPKQVYCSNICAKKSLEGPGSHFWKGGLTQENKRLRNSALFTSWREQVFKRDDWTCQKCGHKSGKLNAHHIKTFECYPEVRLEVANGITLCLACHQLAHIHNLNRTTRALAEMRKP